jgi:hypothetical protein
MVLALGMSAAVGAGQGIPTAPSTDLPTSWTCPMHAQILETEPGRCSICKMKLEAIKLDSIWSCPLHSVVARANPGTCPICRRDLVQLTVARSWTCAGTAINQIERGTCPDGSPMVAKYTPRAHGNHNPQHGGLFFMAPDNWHHLEGAYPRGNRFVLYLYDDYSKPLPPDTMRQVKGRVITRETFDRTTGTTKEIEAFPLTLFRGDTQLEARIDSPGLPAMVTAKVRLKPGEPEYRFDFAFAEFSREPAVATSPSASQPSRGGSVDVRQAPPGAAGDVTAEAATLAARHLKARQKLAQMHVKTEEMKRLLESGAFLEMYVPALAAKDVALELESFADAVDQQQRKDMMSAVRRLVAAAWLLDMYGDLGDRPKLAEAYTVFASAVNQIDGFFAATP